MLQSLFLHDDADDLRERHMFILGPTQPLAIVAKPAETRRIGDPVNEGLTVSHLLGK